MLIPTWQLHRQAERSLFYSYNRAYLSLSWPNLTHGVSMASEPEIALPPEPSQATHNDASEGQPPKKRQKLGSGGRKAACQPCRMRKGEYFPRPMPRSRALLSPPSSPPFVLRTDSKGSEM